MKKDVVNKTETEVVTADLGAWGAPQVSSKDIVIPRILCMQPISELVVNDKAKAGDFIDSLTEEVIGDIDKKPLTFIPFHLEKVWKISKKTGGDFEYDRIETVTSLNESLPYEQVIDGVTYKNEYCMNFFVLLPNDTSLPYVISFKGTSSKAGKVLATQMYVRNAKAGKIPPAYAMKLTGEKTKNDKGHFVVMNVAVDRESTTDEIKEAFSWYKTVEAGQAKVAEEAPSSKASEENRF